MHFITLDNVI